MCADRGLNGLPDVRVVEPAGIAARQDAIDVQHSQRRMIEEGSDIDRAEVGDAGAVRGAWRAVRTRASIAMSGMARGEEDEEHEAVMPGALKDMWLLVMGRPACCEELRAIFDVLRQLSQCYLILYCVRAIASRQSLASITRDRDLPTCSHFWSAHLSCIHECKVCTVSP